jgi:type IV secretion system protein VirB10
MVGVLLSRGPDAVLARGSTLEMVLDRPISYTERELDFGNYQAPRPSIAGAPEPTGSDRGRSGLPLPRRRDQ